MGVGKPGTTDDFKAGLCQGSLTKVGAVAKPLLEGKAPPKSQNTCDPAVFQALWSTL